MTITDEIKAMMSEPAPYTQVEKLEAVVRERTPAYVSLNHPQYDEELLKAHIELAKLYGQVDCFVGKAREHLREAESEFLNMCRVRTQQSTYIFSDTDLYALARKEREVEGELSAYRNQMLEVAKKIGYDATGFLFEPTSTGNGEKDLEDLLRETFYHEPSKPKLNDEI